MDRESKNMLDVILAKDISEITESDIAILKARSSYLSESDKEKFAELMGEEVKKAKKSKKGEEEE